MNDPEEQTEQITLFYWKDDTNGMFCVPRVILHIIRRAHLLGQPPHLHFTCLCTYGKICYLTGTGLTLYLYEIAFIVHLSLSPVDLSQYSVHSWCIWVAVLLHQTGKNCDYTKKHAKH
jgi:hypothetical protein